MMIRVGNRTFPAVRCPICPGQTLISPPAALEHHLATHNGRECRRCGQSFIPPAGQRNGQAYLCRPCRSEFQGRKGN